MNVRDYFIGTFRRILHRPSTLTAAGTGDNTEVTGPDIDLSALGNPKSLSVSIGFITTLTATKTLTLKNVRILAGETASPTDVFATATASVVVATGPGGGGSRYGCYRFDVDLSGAGRYCRLQFTPDLSASGTDTAEVWGDGIFGGAINEPAGLLGVADAGHEAAYTP